MVHPVNEEAKRLHGAGSVGTGEDDGEVGESGVRERGTAYGSVLNMLGGG